MYWMGFIIGLFVGTFVGILIAGLCHAAAQDCYKSDKGKTNPIVLTEETLDTFAYYNKNDSFEVLGPSGNSHKN